MTAHVTHPITPPAHHDLVPRMRLNTIPQKNKTNQTNMKNFSLHVMVLSIAGNSSHWASAMILSTAHRTAPSMSHDCNDGIMIFLTIQNACASLIAHSSPYPTSIRVSRCHTGAFGIKKTSTPLSASLPTHHSRPISSVTSSTGYPWRLSSVTTTICEVFVS